MQTIEVAKWAPELSRPPMPQVEAHRQMLRAALADPLNQHFVLLSESCVPLYPAAALYWQLVRERRSRVAACPASNMNEERWARSGCAGGIGGWARLFCPGQRVAGAPWSPAY